MRKLVAIAIFCSIFSFPSASAQISPTLAISPAKFDLGVVPGQLQQVEIKISNRSDVPIPMSVEVMDWAPKDSRGAIEFGKSLPGHSAVGWFDTSEKDLLLDAGAQKNIKVSFTPPELTKPGSYFAVVMFQSQLPSTYFEQGAQTQIIPWIGTLFFLSAGEPPAFDETALTIKSFSLPRFSFGASEVPASLVLVNNTNFHLAPETEFELMSLRQRTLSQASQEDSIVMPGSERLIEAKLETKPSLGIYIGAAQIRLPNFSKTVLTPTVFYLTSYHLAVLGLIIVALILAVRFRRRVVLAFRVMIRSR